MNIKILTQRLLPILIVLLLTFSFSVNAQQPGKFEIAGKIKSIENLESVSLAMQSGGPGRTEEKMITTVPVKNGVFRITGEVAEGPRLFFLYINKTQNFISLFLNNDKVYIEDRAKPDFKQGNLSNYFKVTGSASDSSYKQLVYTLGRMSLQYNNNIRGYFRKIEAEGEYSKEGIEGILTSRNIFNNVLFYSFRGLLEAKPHNQAIPIILLNVFPWIGKDSSLPRLYHMLDDNVKNTYYGKILGEYVNSCIGKKAPSFTVRSAEGNAGKLEDITASSKLTLVYFCNYADRKPEILRELGGFYEKYRQKGLNIVNVYVDTDADVLSKAVKRDKITWNVATDAKGPWDGIAKQYGYAPVVEPFIFLVDQKGQIIEWAVGGIVLQYYLEKILG
jgi:peroxiredoxin